MFELTDFNPETLFILLNKPENKPFEQARLSVISPCLGLLLWHKYQPVKIALAQINLHIGNFEHNLESMLASIAEAKSQNADLILFPELAVCGYPPRDFLEFSDFVRRCDLVLERLAEESEDLAIVVGSPSRNPKIEGKDLFNSAYFLYEGKIQDVVHKALLPTYDIFDEYRYFEPYEDFHVIHFKGKKLAITVCEDLWNVGNENPLYPDCPMDQLIKQEPDIMLNISASPFDFNHAADRIAVMKENCKLYKLPLFYCNSVGAQTEVIFDGGSLVINSQGELVDEMPYFEEQLRVYDLDEVQGDQQNSEWGEQNKDKMDLIYRALVLGIRDYFGKLGFKKAILGMSGGIDSALSLALACEALGAENVLAVMMPSRYSSDHSISDSVRMCQNLGNPVKEISIEEVFSSSLNVLNPHFEGKEPGLAEENMQARIRALYLMALSNKHGYILLNTSNKSEAAVGYGTLYGDMCGGLSVIGDIYKMEVYELSRYINRNGEIIPENIITKAPSAELRPDQKDSDSLPEYDVLDEILRQYIEHRKGPREIIEMGFDEALVRRTLLLVNRNEYKRYQTPPMLRVSQKAFGMGRRMPIVARYLG